MSEPFLTARRADRDTVKTEVKLVFDDPFAFGMVLVDMASIEGIYRIFAFLVLGCLMIGASYIYHRVEKRLIAEASGEEGRTVTDE